MKFLTRLAAAVAVLASSVAAAGTAEDLDAARALAREGRQAEALARVDATLERVPEDPQALFLRGVILAEEERSEEAIAIFERLTEAHPELPEPYNNLAVLRAATGDYAGAREALLLAIKTHPSYATAHENLGDVYAKMAALAYDRALHLDGASPSARAKLDLIDELFSAPSHPAPAAPPVTVAAAAPAPAQPAAAKPAPPRAPAPGTGEASESHADGGAVLTTVVAWAQAWSRQDVEAYLGFYARDFAPTDGESRAAWERERRERVRAPRFIDVDLRDARVAMVGPERADVTFTQSYRSDTYRDRVRKRLTMQWTGDEWKIVDERTVQ